MSLLRKIRRNVKRAHAQRAKVKRFQLEHLEPRIMLAADLQVESFALNLTGSDLMGPEGLGPFNWGQQLDLAASVTNTGLDDALGDATVMFYLSEDNTLDTGTDTLLVSDPDPYTISGLAA